MSNIQVGDTIRMIKDWKYLYYPVLKVGETYEVEGVEKSIVGNCVAEFKDRHGNKRFLGTDSELIEKVENSMENWQVGDKFKFVNAPSDMDFDMDDVTVETFYEVIRTTPFTVRFKDDAGDSRIIRKDVLEHHAEKVEEQMITLDDLKVGMNLKRIGEADDYFKQGCLYDIRDIDQLNKDVLVYDDNNKPHVLTLDYLNKHFEIDNTPSKEQFLLNNALVTTDAPKEVVETIATLVKSYNPQDKKPMQQVYTLVQSLGYEISVIDDINIIDLD